MQTNRRMLLRAAATITLAGLGGALVAQAQPKPRIIPIVSKKFTYEPPQVTLKLNEQVIFKLTTLDVVMGFSVPDFGVRATIIPGQIVELPMTPTKIGEFTYVCDVFCGSGHEDMSGTLRVVA